MSYQGETSLQDGFRRAVHVQTQGLYKTTRSIGALQNPEHLTFQEVRDPWLVTAGKDN